MLCPTLILIRIFQIWLHWESTSQNISLITLVLTQQIVFSDENEWEKLQTCNFQWEMNLLKLLVKSFFFGLVNAEVSPSVSTLTNTVNIMDGGSQRNDLYPPDNTANVVQPWFTR